MVNQQISYVPQDHSLLPWRTVEENLLLPADVCNIARETLRPKIKELLARFDLAGFAKAYPAALSGGMRAKVALLRATLHQTPLLLLDEPFASLDAITRIEMQRWLLDLRKSENLTVVLVTHDIREAVFLSDTILLLERGAIKATLSTAANTTDLEQKLLSLLRV